MPRAPAASSCTRDAFPKPRRGAGSPSPRWEKSGATESGGGRATSARGESGGPGGICPFQERGALRDGQGKKKALGKRERELVEDFGGPKSGIKRRYAEDAMLLSVE